MVTRTELLDPRPPPLTAPGDNGLRHRLVATGVIVVLAVGWFALGAVRGGGLPHLLPLVVAVLLLVQLVVRRRQLSTAFARDTRSLARRWPGKVLVAGVLLGIPALLVLESYGAGRYADDTWTALLMATVLAAAYVAFRRLLLTVLIAGVVVTTTLLVMAPDLATDRNGDAAVLADLTLQGDMGTLDGLHDVAVAMVDLDDSQPIRVAGLGADETTPMEVGSLTKAMTGLVIADAVRRGELSLDAPVSTYLPRLAGSPAGTVTMNELVTHTAGYAEFGAATLRRAAWSAPVGRNFLTTGTAEMIQEARNGSLSTRGRYVYSTLGAAVAGQAAAAAAGSSYADLMATRLFGPLDMTHTAVQDHDPLVPGGRSTSGLPVQPWTFGGYAPGGAVVSTAGDLANLAVALLDGTAPGMAALEPTAGTARSNTRIGSFWRISTWGTGQTITWHSGQTGGYTSYFGLDRAHNTATIVLADVASPTTEDLGIGLLADRD